MSDPYEVKEITPAALAALVWEGVSVPEFMARVRRDVGDAAAGGPGPPRWHSLRVAVGGDTLHVFVVDHEALGGTAIATARDLDERWLGALRGLRRDREGADADALEAEIARLESRLSRGSWVGRCAAAVGRRATAAFFGLPWPSPRGA